MRRISLAWLSRWAIAMVISLAVIIGGGQIMPLLSTSTPSPMRTFQQVWETVNDYFFDPNFNGVDWQAIRATYEPKVKQVHSIEEAAPLINQMLAELDTSHTQFYTPDEPAYYQILGIFESRIPDLQEQIQHLLPNGKLDYSGIGIFTKERNGQIFISGILDGGPAAQAGLVVGDRIVSVEGQPFRPIQSFADKAGQPVTLQIQRSATAAPQDVLVTPALLDPTTLFMDALKASVQTVERQGKTLGYIHIWSYAGDQYQQQLEEELLYGRLRDADALVLDLRDGWGGAPLTALNIYTAETLSVTNILRDRSRYTYHSRWGKPVVLLVNEGSRSAKELIAYGFQAYNIGPVVGTPTPGAVVGGRPFLMQDGSLVYLAVADVYVNGDYRLEGKGVTPNILVPFSLEYAQGDDPQKEKALDVALEAAKLQG